MPISNIVWLAVVPNCKKKFLSDGLLSVLLLAFGNQREFERLTILSK